MSDLSPLSEEERKSNFGAARTVFDPKATSVAQWEAPTGPSQYAC